MFFHLSYVLVIFFFAVFVLLHLVVLLIMSLGHHHQRDCSIRALYSSDTEGTTIGLPPVYHHGSEELKQRVMGPCVKGEKAGTGLARDVRGLLSILFLRLVGPY